MIARRLGEYLDCPAEWIDAAADAQQRESSTPSRLGEFMLEDEIITMEELLAAVQAQRVDRLRACELFAVLTGQELEDLSAVFQEVHAVPGEELIHQDEKDPHLYVLATGALDVYRIELDGTRTVLATLEPGEPVGEMGYFTNGVRSACVRAQGHCQLLRARYEDLSDSFESMPNVANAFLEVVTRRLRQTDLLYQDNAYSRPASYRVLDELSEFVELPQLGALEERADGLLQRFVKASRRLVNADAAILYLVDPESGELFMRAKEGPAFEVRGDPRTIIGPVMGTVVAQRAMAQGQLVNVENPHSDQRFEVHEIKPYNESLRNLLCAPVRGLRGESLGAIEVANKSLGVFDSQDENMLRVFADQASVAIQNFDLYQRALRSYERMALMFDLSTMMNQVDDLWNLMRPLGQRIAKAVGCEYGHFFALDRKDGRLWSVLDSGEESREVRFRPPQLTAGLCARTGDVVHVADAAMDERCAPDFDREAGGQTRNLLCVPVRNNGAIVGAIQAHNKLGGRFEEGDIRTLKAISFQLGASSLLNRGFAQDLEQPVRRDGTD